MKKIVITGSSQWQDRIVIKDTIFNIKQKYSKTEKIEIISGGLKNGVDSFVKKYCLEFDVPYAEMPPFHYPHSMYSVLPPFRYNKENTESRMYARNEYIAKYGDILVLFLYKDIDSKILTNLALVFERKQKKVLIFK